MIFPTLCVGVVKLAGWVDVERYGNVKLDGLRTFFPSKNGFPSHDTLGRGFGRRDTVEFYAVMQSDTNEIAGHVRGQTVDINCNRRSIACNAS